MIFRKLKEECGVFGIFANKKETAFLVYIGLHAIQHRGQESAGIAIVNDGDIVCHKGIGLIDKAFSKNEIRRMKGCLAIGHVRYSTTGSSSIQNAQPIIADTYKGKFAVAHNGNLTNYYQLKESLERSGSIFQGESDSEVIIHLISRSKKKQLVDSIFDTLKKLKGAYSLLLMTGDKLIGIRDPYGFRPLVLGRRKGKYILSSESCAIDMVEGKYIREIEPGETVIIEKNKLRSKKFSHSKKISKCIFEYVYLARPDSIIFGDTAHCVRERFGEQLAHEYVFDYDVVVPIPDSGLSAAMGYSRASGIRLERGLIRNHYIGRTFINPSSESRRLAVKMKLQPIKATVKDKKVVVVDDSIVRGTTAREIIRILRNSGAKRIAFLSASSPIKYPCYFGIDTPTFGELIASNKDIKGIMKFLNVDILGYLSVKGMRKAVKDPSKFCYACFNGNYPINIDKLKNKISYQNR